MKTVRPPRLLAFLVCAALLSGCAGFPGFGPSAPPHSHPRADSMAAPREQSALQEGIRRYNEGDFNGAIRCLNSHEIASSPVSTRITALKYTAFSYCVTSRPSQCQHAFEKAIKLDPEFDLAPGEHGHPLWGPVFAKARNGR